MNFLYYWQEAVDFFDECLGLELIQKKRLTKNVRSRYTIKADKDSAGAAYYSISHVAINSASVHRFSKETGEDYMRLPTVTKDRSVQTVWH